MPVARLRTAASNRTAGWAILADMAPVSTTPFPYRSCTMRPTGMLAILERVMTIALAISEGLTVRTSSGLFQRADATRAPKVVSNITRLRVVGSTGT